VVDVFFVKGISNVSDIPAVVVAPKGISNVSDIPAVVVAPTVAGFSSVINIP
jgi:hypothetical protein